MLVHSYAAHRTMTMDQSAIRRPFSSYKMLFVAVDLHAQVELGTAGSHSESLVVIVVTSSLYLCCTSNWIRIVLFHATDGLLMS